MVGSSCPDEAGGGSTAPKSSTPQPSRETDRRTLPGAPTDGAEHGRTPGLRPLNLPSIKDLQRGPDRRRRDQHEHGREVTVKVDAGCQPGSVVVVKGEGAPRLDRGGRGDLHVMVSVQVPKKLSKNAKRLLQELESELKGEGERATTAS